MGCLLFILGKKGSVWSKVHWKWGDGAEGLILVQDRWGLLSSLPHVALHSVELWDGPTVRLPRSSFDHVAAVLWSPKRGVTANRGKRAVKTFSFYTLASVSEDHSDSRNLCRALWCVRQRGSNGECIGFPIPTATGISPGWRWFHRFGLTSWATRKHNTHELVQTHLHCLHRIPLPREMSMTVWVC